MAAVVTVNDPILQPFLRAKDSDESQRELVVLLSEHAESRIKGIILSRLRSYPSSQEDSADFEDLYSETKTRLLAYLNELKADRRTVPCEDFRGYVAAVAHNACHDHFRQTYPRRARLHKKIRDLLNAHPNFANWKSHEQKKGAWVCGFHHWRGREISSYSTAWLQRFYESPEIVTDTLASGGDVEGMTIADLLAAIFKDIGEPIRVDDLVSLVSDIRGIRDAPAAFLDSNGESLSLPLPDSRLRVDSVLEMREPLTHVWKGLRELSRDQLRAYLLYARDSWGEDLISLFLDAEITTESEIAGLLEMTIRQFRDLCVNRLPMNNEAIANELGVKVERVYKLRCQAGKRLKQILSAHREKTTVVRQKSHISPS